MKVMHIYQGAVGSNSQYIQRITRALKNHGIESIAIVNYYYEVNSFNDGIDIKKLFFRFTEREGLVKNRKRNWLAWLISNLPALRLVIRYVEKLFGYIRTLYLIKNYKLDLVNLSINDTLLITYYFALLLSKLSIKHSFNYCITIHDAQSLMGVKYNRMLIKIFNTSNAFICHTESSANYIKEKFPNSSVVIHSFPPLDTVKEKNEINKKEKIIGFVGYLRKSKNPQILIDAWVKMTAKDRNGYNLIFKGALEESSYPCFDSLIHDNSVIISTSYISSSDFFKFLKKCRFIVLPYDLVTNSGVLSAAVCNGCIPILSRLNDFMVNEYSRESLFFEKGNIYSLLSILKTAINFSDNKVNYLCQKQLKLAKQIEDKFEKNVIKAYTNLLIR